MSEILNNLNDCTEPSDNIIDCDTFCNILKSIQRFDNDRLNQFYVPDRKWYRNTIFSLLKKMFLDDAGDIAYFCNQLDFGKSYTEGCVMDGNNNIIDLSSMEALYNHLVKHRENRKKGLMVKNNDKDVGV